MQVKIFLDTGRVKDDTGKRLKKLVGLLVKIASADVSVYFNFFLMLPNLALLPKLQNLFYSLYILSELYMYSDNIYTESNV